MENPLDPETTPASDTAALQAHIAEQNRDITMEHLKARQRFRAELAARPALVGMGFRRADARLALQRVRDALHAEHTHFFTHQGVVTDERATVDHRTRLHAARAMFDMIPGVKAPQEIQNAAQTIQLEVVTVAPDGTRTAVRVTR
jgi:hypothetical protein